MLQMAVWASCMECRDSPPLAVSQELNMARGLMRISWRNNDHVGEQWDLLLCRRRDSGRVWEQQRARTGGAVHSIGMNV